MESFRVHIHIHIHSQQSALLTEVSLLGEGIGTHVLKHSLPLKYSYIPSGLPAFCLKRFWWVYFLEIFILIKSKLLLRMPV